MAFTLQNCEGWYARSIVAKIEPQIVTGSVRKISVVPSTTSTSYLLVADLGKDEVAQVVISREDAVRCKIGAPVRIAKRGVNYRFMQDGCLPEPASSPESTSLSPARPIG
jgi:hypothetical protein